MTTKMKLARIGFTVAGFVTGKYQRCANSSLLLLLLVFSMPIYGQSASVLLSWDPNIETDLGGYNLYYRESTQVSPAKINVGNLTSYSVPSLTEGKTYSFHVTAYNTSGLESVPSNEVNYTIPTSVIQVNTAPIVTAGLNLSITFPALVSLSATISDDGLPNPPATVTVSWSKVSGPGSVSFSNPNGAATTASFSVEGTYVLRITANDSALTSTSDLTVLALAAPTGNPVAAYAFDEGSGSIASDASGNGNTGTISGATWTAGRFGNALQFNGTAALVTVNDSASLDLTTGMTLEAWVYPTSTAAIWRDLIYKGANDTYYLEGSSPQGGAPAMGGTYTSSPLYGTTALPVNTWSHLAATYDGATMRLYVNGAQAASRAQSGSIATSTGALTFGGDALYGQYWAGRIDEVRIYNRALSATEIQSDMNTSVGLPPNQPPLALGQSVQTLSGSAVQISLSGSDPEGQPLAFSIVNPPGSGSLTGTPPLVTYQPNPQFVGNDSFTFKVNDGSIDSSPAAVSISVLPVNGLPAVTAGPDQTITLPNSVSLSATISDDGLPNPPGTVTVSWTKVSGPGSVTFSNPNTAATTASFSVEGTYLLRITANDGALTSSSELTVVVLAAPISQIVVLPFEAESGTLASPMTTFSDALASQGQYIASTTDFTGTASYTFNAPVSGNYIVWCRILAPDSSRDSFFVSVDGLGEDIYLVAQSANWQWTRVNGYNSQANPRIFSLSAGNHALVFRAREMNTKLDRIIITNDPDFLPPDSAPNQPPIADSQSISTLEDTAVNLVLSGSDPEAQPLTYSIVSGPTKGQLSGVAPSLSYSPNANFNGVDSFTFKVNDGAVDSSTATVTITVAAVNDAPVALASSLITPESVPAPITLSGSDPDGDALSFSIVSGPLNGALSGTAPLLTYTPNLAFYGSDSFSFKASDGKTESSLAVVTISVTRVNKTPVVSAGSNQTITLPGSVALSAAVSDDGLPNPPGTVIVTWSKASGPGSVSFSNPNTPGTTASFSSEGTYVLRINASDGALISTSDLTVLVLAANKPPIADATWVSTLEDTPVDLVLSASDPEGNPLTYVIVSSPANGQLSGVAPNLRYSPNGNFNGSDSFTFKVNDGSLDSATATVNIILTAVNDPPVALAGSVNTLESVPAPITLSGSDPDGDALSFTVVSGPLNGTLSGTAPLLTYTPNLSFYGNDSFSFKASDGKTESSLAVVTISVTRVNKTPVVSAGANQTITSPGSVALSAAVSDDGLPNPPGAVTVSWSKASGPGLVAFSNPNTPGTTASFSSEGTYVLRISASDGVLTSTSDLTVVALPANKPPTANTQLVSTVEDTPLDLVLSGSDPDGNPLTYLIVSSPTKGQLSGSAPNLRYSPNANFNGADSFTFKVNDGRLDSATATVNISVTPANDPPVAAGTSITTLEGVPAAIALSGYDPNGDGLTFTIVSAPLNGTLSGTAPSLIYTPKSYFYGVDSFTFKVSDGKLESSAATANISVTPVNDPPISGTDTVQRLRDKPLRVLASKLLANDMDPEGDLLSMLDVQSPSANGATVYLEAGYVNYIAPRGFNSADLFTYWVSDGKGGIAIGQVNVLVKESKSPKLKASLTSSGTLIVSSDAVAGEDYLIQASSSLISGEWTTLATATADANGRFEFQDTTQYSMRFYRAVLFFVEVQ